MELRCHPRINTRLPVIVRHGEERLGTFRTRDLSLGGLFLNTGPSDLPRNSTVHLRLLAEGHNRLVHGRVARLSEQGLGVVVTAPEALYANTVLDVMGDTLADRTGKHASGPAAQGLWPTEGPPHELTIHTAEQFDMVACRQFVRAARLMQEDELMRVVVDLEDTREVLDSGLALLRMLREQDVDQAGRVVLVNCAHRGVRERLQQAGFSPT